MKKVTGVLLCLIIVFSFVGCSSQENYTESSSIKAKVEAVKKDKLSNVEKDAYIIYNLSYTEAGYQGGKSSKTIKVTEKSNKTTYTFVEHVLSCGTHMNGKIVETIKGKTKTIKGSFDVTKNPYKINGLKVNIKVNTKTNKKSGYLTVDGENLDINSNFQPIN